MGVCVRTMGFGRDRREYGTVSLPDPRAEAQRVLSDRLEALGRSSEAQRRLLDRVRADRGLPPVTGPVAPGEPAASAPDGAGDEASGKAPRRILGWVPSVSLLATLAAVLWPGR